MLAARFMSVLACVAISSAALTAVQKAPGPGLGARPAAQQRVSGASAPALAPPQAFLNRYCTRCHGERRQVAGLALDSLDLSDVGAHAERWEQVVRKLRVGVMPPMGQPRPDGTTRDAFV